LWADCHSDQATISTPPNALIRRSFALGAVFSPISFAFAYVTQLQYGNSNHSAARIFHWLTYLSFLIAILLFGSGVCFAARAFLAL
jgi:hypothetical protein